MSFWYGASATRLPLTLQIKYAPVVLCGRLLAHLRPTVLERVLSILSRGARPADIAGAEAALVTIGSWNYRLAGPRACLPRSIAAALLCRCRGYWPEWHVGTRTQPPFRAHAWLAVGSRIVLEPGDAESYASLLSVKPGPRGHHAHD